MHRTVFLAAILIAAALDALTGCAHPHPYPSSAYDDAELPAFVMDGLTRSRSFSLRLHLDGEWWPSGQDETGYPTDPGLRVAVEVEPLMDEAVAPIGVHILDATDGTPIGEATLEPNEDEAIAVLDAREALADCEPDVACDVELLVRIDREGDTGAMLATLRADGNASGPPGEPPTYQLELGPFE